MSEVIPRLNAALEGRYHVERELGAGGMATVYLAHDLRHDRRVALKVLKPELAAVVGAERFLAEIKTTANLQHPHILPLFDSGEAGTFLFYVMPYVEGESLRERLDREQQLPVDVALRIATDVADALQAAHEQGVIHRDVKPANILLVKGRPLVADFGIALAVGAAGGGRLTETGLSMGTPYYMSPEQASADREPTAASDVYSLGCVLYEMLVGEPPYMGGSAQAVLAKILTEDAPVPRKGRSSISPNVDAAIRKALEKLPADRFATAEELGRALADPGFRHGDATAVGSGAARGLWNPLSVTATVLAAVFGLLALLSLGSGPDGTTGPGVVRSYLELPPGTYMAEFTPFVLSADGRTLVVTGRARAGQPLLLRRDLGRLEFEAIPGTELGLQPAFSPDEASLLMRHRGRLVRVLLEGGPVVELDSEANYLGAQWAPDGTVYYGRAYNTGLWQVSSEGGPAAPLTNPDVDSRELGHWWPQMLPGGEHLMFTAYRSPVDSSRIRAVSLETGVVTTLLEGGYSARYAASGHLLFARGGDLYAVAFDATDLRVIGAPYPVVEDVAVSQGDGLALFAMSESGTLVYVEAEELCRPSSIVSVDRATGQETELAVPRGQYRALSLSPDGAMLALDVNVEGHSDVLTYDLARERLSALAGGPGNQFNPMWTGDGQRVIYTCEVVAYDICAREPNSSRPEAVLVASADDKQPYSLTPDGSGLLYVELPVGAKRFLIQPLGEPASAPDTLRIDQQGLAAAPTLSPSGRWVAFTSNETGESEVWIQGVDPGASGRWRVSSNGGSTPLWTKGGRELVYRDLGGGVFAVTVDPANGEPGPPGRLFDQVYADLDSRYRGWDVTPDGERFYFVKPSGTELPQRLVLVQGFFEELNRLVPTN